MQPVNDDMEDMDNLFRQAADHYPLNTSGADFDKVRALVDVETGVPKEKEPKRRYLWLLLLLLVPSPFLLRHYQIDPIPRYSQSIPKYQAAPQEDQKRLRTATVIDTNTNTIEKPVFVTKENKVNEQLSNTSTTPNPETVDKKVQPGWHTVANHTNNSIRKHQINRAENKVSANSIERQSTFAISKREKKQRSTNESVFLQSGTKNSYKNTFPFHQKENGTAPKKSIKTTDHEQQNTDNRPQTTDHGQQTTGSAITDSTRQTIASPHSLDTSTSSKTNKTSKTPDKAVVTKKTTNNSRSKSGLYIGIITGPDFSMVKSKRIDGAGYNIGFLAGYHTGRHLALETGFIWNYKRYYSEGTNVSTEKLGLPLHTELLDLNGSCMLIEIPLNLQYHFNSHTNGNWYMGAGVSSYIMKKEDYNYESKRYNMQYYGYKEYTNSTNNWLSVLQLQVGYQINFKHAGSLRMEPYAKLPLQKIGIGKLPLSSAGVNFGYTLPIH